MQLFPVGKVYNFMAHRRGFLLLSLFMVIASIVLLFRPGPNLGTDFVGGTEIEVAFKQPVRPADIRQAAVKAGFSRPDVVRVTDADAQNRFLIRVQEVSTIAPETRQEIAKKLCFGDKLDPARCPAEREATELKVSPGGDKITLRFRETPDLEWIREQVKSVSSIKLRPGENNPTIQNARDNKVEVQLMSKGDQLMSGLINTLGPSKVPEQALRTEWIGPKAGRQLRDAALKSIAIALVFIMAYIAFRFDLRFAPGGVLALAHDATVAVGVLTILQKELNLTTVAAILTIIGYSINDTVVVYDRVRENLGKLRGSTFTHIINVSLSEMLSRTFLTSGTTIFSLMCFFIWGTGTIKDFALALIIGLLLGTYSSMYVALPVTEWLDRKFFGQLKASRKRALPARTQAA